MPIVTFGRVLAVQIAVASIVVAGVETVLSDGAWRGTVISVTALVSTAVIAGIAHVLRVRFGEVERRSSGKAEIGLTPRIAAAIGLVVALAAVALLGIHHFIAPARGASRALWYCLTIAVIIVVVDWWYFSGLKGSRRA
jgi:nitrogen fixation/metabolism regulation signal transduction histidine kinase